MYNKYRKLLAEAQSVKDNLEDELMALYDVDVIANENGLSVYSNNFVCYIYYGDNIELSARNCGTEMPTPEAYKAIYTEAEALRVTAKK